MQLFVLDKTKIQLVQQKCDLHLDIGEVNNTPGFLANWLNNLSREMEFTIIDNLQNMVIISL